MIYFASTRLEHVLNAFLYEKRDRKENQQQFNQQNLTSCWLLVIFSIFYLSISIEEKNFFHLNIKQKERKERIQHKRLAELY